MEARFLDFRAQCRRSPRLRSGCTDACFHAGSGLVFLEVGVFCGTISGLTGTLLASMSSA